MKPKHNDRRRQLYAVLVSFMVISATMNVRGEVQFQPPFETKELPYNVSLLKLTYRQGETSTTAEIEIHYRLVNSNRVFVSLMCGSGKGRHDATPEEHRETLNLLKNASASDAFEQYNRVGNWLMGDLKTFYEKRCQERVELRAGAVVSDTEQKATVSEGALLNGYEHRFYYELVCSSASAMKVAIQESITLLANGSVPMRQEIGTRTQIVDVTDVCGTNKLNGNVQPPMPKNVRTNELLFQ